MANQAYNLEGRAHTDFFHVHHPIKRVKPVLQKCKCGNETYQKDGKCVICHLMLRSLMEEVS